MQKPEIIKSIQIALRDICKKHGISSKSEDMFDSLVYILKDMASSDKVFDNEYVFEPDNDVSSQEDCNIERYSNNTPAYQAFHDFTEHVINEITEFINGNPDIKDMIFRKSLQLNSAYANSIECPPMPSIYIGTDLCPVTNHSEALNPADYYSAIKVDRTEVISIV